MAFLSDGACRPVKVVINGFSPPLFNGVIPCFIFFTFWLLLIFGGFFRTVDRWRFYIGLWWNLNDDGFSMCLWSFFFRCGSLNVGASVFLFWVQIGWFDDDEVRWKDGWKIFEKKSGKKYRVWFFLMSLYYGYMNRICSLFLNFDLNSVSDSVTDIILY